MTAEVVNFNGVTRLDLPAERILNGALTHDLESAVIIGFNRDGELYFSSSLADGGTVLWLMELAKIELMKTEIPE